MSSEPTAVDRATALLRQLDALIIKRDRPGAIAAALAAVEAGDVTVPVLHALVLSPLMQLTGARWQSGEEQVWEEHYATGVVRTIVESLAPAVLAHAASAAPAGRTIVLTCPPQEYHDLGLRMMLDRFLIAGYDAHFLGADMPLEELAGAVRDLGADTVLVSASTHFHLLGLRTYVDGLRAEVPGITVWLGGAAFAHGHEGWTDEVVDVAALLGDLGEANA
ncbi:MAG: cobalamin B12-binding domain-containing protein [Coriobacteriia bacterium]